MDKYKFEILNFFKCRKFYLSENTEYQKQAILYFQDRDVEYHVTSDSRNYEHSIGIVLAFNKYGKLPLTSYYSELSTPQSIEKEFENFIFVLNLTISDIVPVCSENWFTIDCSNSEQGKSSSILREHLPESILSKSTEFRKEIEEKIQLYWIEDEILDTHVNWLQELPEYEHFDYRPTFRELLFGGLDIYNNLNL